MTPTVFISSTIEDLHHVRDAIRETIQELGYQPVMSDHGEIGYMDDWSAAESCFKTVPECQIMVLVIGKRYGSLLVQKGKELSITEHEYDACMESNPRLIAFVEAEVLHFEKVYRQNKGKSTSFPNMDNAERTFAFLQKVRSAPNRNGFLPFSTAADVRKLLKKQFATLFANLLRTNGNPSKNALDEIVSEVKTIREALATKKAPDLRYRAAIRFLLTDKHNEFRNFLRAISEDFEVLIPSIYEANDLQSFLKKIKMSCKVETIKDLPSFLKTRAIRYAAVVPFYNCEEEPAGKAEYAIGMNGDVFMNHSALKYLSRAYSELKQRIDQAAAAETSIGY